MRLMGSAAPNQLAVLEQALADHCRDMNIEAGTAEHERMASRVYFLYSAGVTGLESLKAALAGKAPTI